VFQLAGKPAVDLTVSGIYRPANSSSPYWWNIPFFNFSPGTITLGGETPFVLDAFFVSTNTTGNVPLLEAAPLVTEEVPLLSGRVGQSDLSSLSTALARYALAIANQHGVTLSTALTSLINRTVSEEQSMAGIAAVIGAQLVMMALLVLYGIVSRSSDSRESEVALAKVHGYRFGGVVAVGLFEPVALITLALPIGLLAAWLGVDALVGRRFVSSTEVAVGSATLLSAAAAYAAAVIAAGAAARKLIVRPLSEQLRASRKPNTDRWTAALDLSALVLAVAGLLELRFGGVLRDGKVDPLALLAPGLLAVAAAVASIRLIPGLCMLGLGLTTGSSHVASFLALRHAYRRRETLRTIVIVAIGSSLATFSIAGWSVADQNRGEVAAFKIGAARVLTVATPNGTDLQALVDRADPSGKKAMASLFYATGSGNLLAVDSARLSAVATWPTGLAGMDSGAIARWLSQSSLPSLTLRGSAVRLMISSAIQGSGSARVQLGVSSSGGGASAIDLGPLVFGPHDYTGKLPADCSAGCRLAGLTPIWSPAGSLGSPGYYLQAATLTLQLSGIETADSIAGPWKPIDSSWSNPSRWIGSRVASVSASQSAAALVMIFNENVGSIPPPTVTSQDTAQAIPAVVTPDMVALNGAGVASRISIEGLDGRSITLDGHYQAPELPRIGTSGAIVDLARILRQSGRPLVPDVVEQVWLSRSAGSTVVQALEREGVTIQAVDEAAFFKHGLDASGLSLAYQLLLFAAAAALVLLVGGTVFGILIGAEPRAQEMAVLRAMGVGDRALMAGEIGEQMLVLASGILVGLAAGIAAAAMVLPAVPEIAGVLLVPLDYGLPYLVLAGLAMALIACLAAIAWAGSGWILRLATPARLRIGLT
jgi:putative ABC transport system permease protein